MSDYTKEKVIDNIMDNYLKMEQSIVNQLFMSNDIHGTTSGSHREETWRAMFENIIPKKFVIERSVFIIDSTYNDESKATPPKGISKEVDLAIIDEQYTPYIFRYGEVKFVPIEAVAAVIECKSTSSNTESWVERIDNLTTVEGGIARLATGFPETNPTQRKTRPLKIFCGLKRKGKSHTAVTENFDFIILANEESLKIDIKIKNCDWTLAQWHKDLNTPIENFKASFPEVKLTDYRLDSYIVERGTEEISLLTFNFQLNQLLMIINNPMLFPHQAYVRMFNKEPKNSLDNEVVKIDKVI